MSVRCILLEETVRYAGGLTCRFHERSSFEDVPSPPTTTTTKKEGGAGAEGGWGEGGCGADGARRKGLHLGRVHFPSSYFHA